MNEQAQNFDELLVRLKARERAAWRSSLLWSIVPVLLAFAFLGYATMRLDSANKEVSQLQVQADSYRSEVEAMQVEIASLRKQLQETLDLSKFEHPVDMVDMKMFFSRYPKPARMLDSILELRGRGVGWHLGGQTPEVGFDSPGFAAYILEERGLLPREAGESLLQASRQLYKRLEPTSEPRIGDLAIYPAGFHMFVFEDKNRQRYVIGMTPSGIIALKPDFAQVVGYRKVQ